MIRHRWYESDRDNDLQRMLALVSEATIAAGPRAGHLHPGDVVWGLFQNTVIDPTTRVHLFEEASGELAGFVVLYPPGHFMIALAPGVADPPSRLARYRMPGLRQASRARRYPEPPRASSAG